jgi:hypothetical protein
MHAKKQGQRAAEVAKDGPEKITKKDACVAAGLNLASEKKKRRSFFIIRNSHFATPFVRAPSSLGSGGATSWLPVRGQF